MFTINLKKLKAVFTENTLPLTIINLLVLTACGAGGGSSSPTPDTPITPQTDITKISIASSWNIPTLDIPSQSYVLVKNNANTTATNLQYNLVSTTNIATDVTIDPTSLSQCSTIQANGSCNLILDVPANAVTTGVVLNISNKINSLNFKSIQNLLTDTQVSSYMGINPITYNNLPTNADGITLVYPHSIDSSRDSTILVEAIVTSSQAGSFNTINLVDANGNTLPATVISGNSGQGASNLMQGDIVTFSLTIPSGTQSLSFYPQTYMTDPKGQVSGLTTATTGQIIDTTSGAIPQIQPFTISLSSENLSQDVTIHNSSKTKSITDIVVKATTPLIINNNNCGAKLEPDSNCSYTVKFDPNTSTTGNGSIGFFYNNGVNNSSLLQNVHYAGLIQGGLSLSTAGTSSLSFVSSSLSTDAAILPLYITNSGNIVESSISLNLPNAYFTITPASNNSCTIANTSAQTVLLADKLGVGASCVVNLVYNNPKTTDLTTAILNANYVYSGVVANTPIGLNYKTLATDGNITLNNGYLIAPKINETKSVEVQLGLTRSGVSNIPVNLNIDNPNIAQIIGNTSCNLYNPNNHTCNINVKGIANGVTNLTATLLDGSKFTESIIVSNQYLITSDIAVNWYLPFRCVINQIDGELYCDHSPIADETLFKQIGYNTTISNNTIYFTYGSDNSLIYCSINNDATLSNCNKYTTSLSNPNGITSIIFAGAPYLYVTNYSGNSIDTLLNQSGTLTHSNSLSMNNPFSISNITIESTTYLYTTYNIAQLQKCKISQENPNPNYCESQAIPTDIRRTIYNTYPTSINNSNYLYILSADINNFGIIDKCLIQNDGSIHNCNRVWTNPVVGFNPQNMKIVQINGGTYAYIGLRGKVHMQKCSVNSDGSFGACVNEQPMSAIAELITR